MTPEELRTICEKNGGQSALARLIGCKQEHMNRMCNGKRAIPDKMANHILLAIKSLNEKNRLLLE